MHVEVVRVTVLGSPAEAIESQPGTPHDHPFVILVLRWRSCPDVLLGLFEMTRLVQLGEDLMFRQAFCLSFGPFTPVFTVNVEERAMEANVLVWRLLLGLSRLRSLASAVKYYKPSGMLTENPPLQPMCGVMSVYSIGELTDSVLRLGSLFSLSSSLVLRALLCSLGEPEPERSRPLALESRLLLCRLVEGMMTS